MAPEFDAAREDAAEIIVGFQRRNQHLERKLIAGECDRLGLGHVFDDELEQRIEILVLVLKFFHRPAIAARCIEIMKVELIVVCFQSQEQVEDRLQRFLRLRVMAVDLVDDDDGLETELQRLGKHEFGLRHDGLGRIDEQNYTVNHRKNALHLAAEVGMAGGVDNINMRAVPFDRRALGQNRNSTLALQVIGVHGALFHGLVLANRTRLLKELVDERRLAMVDMGDDRDIADIHRLCALEGKRGLIDVSPIRSNSRPRRPWLSCPGFDTGRHFLTN